MGARLSRPFVLSLAGLPGGDGGLDKLDKSRCGCLIGSAMGGFETFSTAVDVLLSKGPKKMNPFCIPFAITNMSSALLAMDLGFMGPNYSCASACASGEYQQRESKRRVTLAPTVLFTAAERRGGELWCLNQPGKTAVITTPPVPVGIFIGKSGRVRRRRIACT